MADTTYKASSFVIAQSIEADKWGNLNAQGLLSPVVQIPATRGAPLGIAFDVAAYIEGPANVKATAEICIEFRENGKLIPVGNQPFTPTKMAAGYEGAPVAFRVRDFPLMPKPCDLAVVLFVNDAEIARSPYLLRP